MSQPRKYARHGLEANRRDEVLRVAAKLFVEKGFAATTTRDIAEAASMRSGSPFYHFRSKQAILQTVIIEGLEAARERMLIAIAHITDQEQRLRLLVRAHLASLHDGDCRSPLLLGETRALDDRARAEIATAFDRYQAPWQETLDALAKEGKLASAAPPVRLLLFGMLNWSSHWYRHDGALSVDELADAVVSLLLVTPCETRGISKRDS